MTNGQTKRVLVWFGPHLLCVREAPPEQADAFAATMPLRFHGLRVTIGELKPGEQLKPLPAERLWPLTIY